VRLYKELADVERCFANLKDVIDMRPIYHQTKERGQAHIFVAALAHLLVSVGNFPGIASK
jgi:transposase